MDIEEDLPPSTEEVADEADDEEEDVGDIIGEIKNGKLILFK